MATTFSDSKSDLLRRAEEQLAALKTKEVAESRLTTRQKLALTCRALFDGGHDSGLAGQITARADADGTYYTQRLGLGFDEITEGNLLLVDEDLNVLDGDGMANPVLSG
jgi:L-fuculose-phosphate aldolase